MHYDGGLTNFLPVRILTVSIMSYFLFHTACFSYLCIGFRYGSNSACPLCSLRSVAVSFQVV